MPFDRLDVKMIFKEINALQYIRLFDEARTQDSVPRPFLIDRPVGCGQLIGTHQIFVQKAILLKEYFALRIIREIHVLNSFFPIICLLIAIPCCLADAIPIGCMVMFGPFDLLKGIFHAPFSEIVSVPVVVDIIFILIGPGHAKHHPGLFVG